MSVSEKVMRATIAELISYHSKQLGLRKIPFRILNSLGPDAADGARAVAAVECWGWGPFSLPTGRGEIRFKRADLLEKWEDPHFIEDLVVHELMHFKARSVGEDGHGREYQKMIANYGFCPSACGDNWRKAADKIINGRDGWGTNWFETNGPKKYKRVGHGNEIR